MKLEHTQKRSARRTFLKEGNDPLYSMPVWLRRQNHIMAADSNEYNRKHGLAIDSVAVPVPSVYKATARTRSNI